MLRALAHPERRRILQACLDQPQAAGDLAAASGLSPASVSEHLKVLRKTGLVVLERRGRFRLYRTERGCVRAVASSIDELVSQPGAHQPSSPVRGVDDFSEGGVD